MISWGVQARSLSLLRKGPCLYLTSKGSHLIRREYQGSLANEFIYELKTRIVFQGEAPRNLHHHTLYLRSQNSHWNSNSLKKIFPFTNFTTIFQQTITYIQQWIGGGSMIFQSHTAVSVAALVQIVLRLWIRFEPPSVSTVRRWPWPRPWVVMTRGRLGDFRAARSSIRRCWQRLRSMI